MALTALAICARGSGPGWRTAPWTDALVVLTGHRLIVHRLTSGAIGAADYSVTAIRNYPARTTWARVRIFVTSPE